MSTIRNVLQFPRIVREMNEKMDPLDLRLEVMREINWQLSRLPDDASVLRCIQFVLEERGFELNPQSGD